MTHSRYHWSAIVFLTAFGCGGEVPQDRGSFLVTSDPTGDEGDLLIGGSVPAWAGDLRVKANGRYLVYFAGDPPLEVGAGHHDELSIRLPPSSYQLELVNGAGQNLLKIEPVAIAPGRTTFVWIHDSPSGLAAEVPDVTPDADPSTVQIRVSNVSADERVTFSLCHEDCHDCCDAGRNDFAPGDCTPLTTVAPGESWSSLQPTNLAPGGGYTSSCVAAQLEGQALTPACIVPLDASASDFQDVLDLFIDGLDQIIQTNWDGSVIGKAPGILEHGNKFF